VSQISVEFTDCNQWFGLQIPVEYKSVLNLPNVPFQTIDLKPKKLTHLKLDNGYLTDYKNAGKK
jgi:hypothetical protein